MEFVFTMYPGKRAAAEVEFTSEELDDCPRGLDGELIFKKCYNKGNIRKQGKHKQGIHNECIKYLDKV